MDAESSRKFFTQLYAAPSVGVKGEFDPMVTRLVAKLGDQIVVGDQALQGLMLNHVLSTPENAAKGKKLAAALAGIKQRSVDEFTKAFPNTNLETLIQEAKKAGYEVEVHK